MVKVMLTTLVVEAGPTRSLWNLHENVSQLACGQDLSDRS